MDKKTGTYIRLGMFVTLGVALLFAAVFYMGQQKNLLGSTFRLAAAFDNVRGLQAGNNVRFLGINVGTVNRIVILSDSLVRVEMSIDKHTQPYIKKDAVCMIGTDGLMGNKIINIQSGNSAVGSVEDGEAIAAGKPIEADSILAHLQVASKQIAYLSGDLRSITGKINRGEGFLGGILADTFLLRDLRSSLASFRKASAHADGLILQTADLMQEVKAGEGAVGTLLRDTVLAGNLVVAIQKLRETTDETATLSHQLSDLIGKANGQKGVVNTLLVDTALASNLQQSMVNIRKGTDGFQENMEALKHTFLLRGYFKRQKHARQSGKKNAARRDEAITQDQPKKFPQ